MRLELRVALVIGALMLPAGLIACGRLTAPRAGRAAAVHDGR